MSSSLTNSCSRSLTIAETICRCASAPPTSASIPTQPAMYFSASSTKGGRRLDRPGLDAAANQVGADAFDDRAAPEVPILSVRDARKRGQYLISALLVRDVGESDTMEVDSGCDDVETAGERSESAPTTGA
jgi:hypothetical protein